MNEKQIEIDEFNDPDYLEELRGGWNKRLKELYVDGWPLPEFDAAEFEREYQEWVKQTNKLEVNTKET